MNESKYESQTCNMKKKCMKNVRHTIQEVYDKCLKLRYVAYNWGHIWEVFDTDKEHPQVSKTYKRIQHGYGFMTEVPLLRHFSNAWSISE